MGKVRATYQARVTLRDRDPDPQEAAEARAEDEELPAPHPTVPTNADIERAIEVGLNALYGDTGVPFAVNVSSERIDS